VDVFPDENIEELTLSSALIISQKSGVAVCGFFLLYFYTN
jgi:hypothetical protein